MRARSALCGIILGDNISASSSLDSATQTLNAQFAEAQKDDHTAIGGGVVKKLDQQHESFVNTTLTKEQISSIRAGNLPPNVTIKTFVNPEKPLPKQ